MCVPIVLLVALDLEVLGDDVVVAEEAIVVLELESDRMLLELCTVAFKVVPLLKEDVGGADMRVEDLRPLVSAVVVPLILLIMEAALDEEDTELPVVRVVVSDDELELLA